MSFKDFLKQQQSGLEAMANTGVIGLHLVSGPLVGFAIGYGLDYWLDTSPWCKLFFLLLGIAAFATVAPLQMGVLQSAGEAGMTLASSLNIAAFNLGNALGAWLGGAVIAQGMGLTWLAWAAAMPAAAALLMASFAPRQTSPVQTSAMAAGMH